MAQAIKASGAIVYLEPFDFVTVLAKAKDPLVVVSVGGVVWTSYRYLFSYKGLAFYTKSSEPLELPPTSETINARSIWIPG
jgi:hypothetical protein